MTKRRRIPPKRRPARPLPPLGVSERSFNVSVSLSMGLHAIYPGPRLSSPNPMHRLFPYLLRRITVSRANQVWVTDITYIPLGRWGFSGTFPSIMRGTDFWRWNVTRPDKFGAVRQRFLTLARREEDRSLAQ